MEQQIIQKYETEISRLSRLYYWLYKDTGNFDLEDLQQVGRMAVLNISRKRPEKLVNKSYVNAAIKYSIFREMKKMRHKAKHIYLTTEDEVTPLVDVLPTNEKGNKLDELEDVLYHIKHEFSEKEAEGLEALLEKCENVYDLNLTQSQSTDTKDRVKVVTVMDLIDEEMRVYAEVLLGVRKKFPGGYMKTEGAGRRAVKYLEVLLSALNLSAKEFAQTHKKYEMLRKYRLISFYIHTYDYKMLHFLNDLDNTITLNDFAQKGATLFPLEVAKILKSYEEYGGAATRSARMLGYSGQTIINQWRKHDLKILPQGKNKNSLTPQKIQEIIDSYPRFQGNAYQAAKHLLYSRNTILYHWRNAGLEISKPINRQKLSEERIGEIKKAHETFNGNAREAARHLPYSVSTIWRYWNKARLGIQNI